MESKNAEVEGCGDEQETEDADNAELNDIARDLEIAIHTVSRNTTEAQRQLTEIDKRLDSLDLGAREKKGEGDRSQRLSEKSANLSDCRSRGVTSEVIPRYNPKAGANLNTAGESR